jgi:hypothetical protein
MNLNEFFDKIDKDNEQEELKEILSNLYDEDKIDFNTELNATQIWCFAEIESVTRDKEKWNGIRDFIHRYEKKMVSKERSGRKEITGLRKNEYHDIRE